MRIGSIIGAVVAAGIVLFGITILFGSWYTIDQQL